MNHAEKRIPLPPAGVSKKGNSIEGECGNMEKDRYICFPWICDDVEYNIAHFANDIYENKIRAYQKDSSGNFIIFDPRAQDLPVWPINIIKMIDNKDLYFDTTELMMLNRDKYKFKLLDLEPRLEEKNALIEKLKNRVAQLEDYSAGEEKRLIDILKAYGVFGGESEQPREKPSQKEELPQKENRGSLAASLERLTTWQTAYIPAMIKAAVELGEEGPKSGNDRRQRKDVLAVLEKYTDDIPAKVLDVLYKSLPDEYVDRTGGNCPMK